MLARGKFKTVSGFALKNCFGGLLLRSAKAPGVRPQISRGQLGRHAQKPHFGQAVGARAKGSGWGTIDVSRMPARVFL